MEGLKQQVHDLLEHVCPSHGYSHAVKVQEHCKHATIYFDTNLSFLIQLSLHTEGGCLLCGGKVVELSQEADAF